MHNIGEVIKKYRLKNNKTQEELGKELFVTKQAISKWENGKTLPDIDTIRKIAVILNIPNDEILEKTIVQTKKYKSVIKVIVPILILSIISMFVMLFFAVDGVGIIERRLQSGVCLIVVHKDGVVINTDDYQIKGFSGVKSGKNGYSFKIDYGEVKGKIITSKNEEIEFGFINTNNWHNVQISVNIDTNSNKVYQTVVYKTEKGLIDVLETESSIKDKKSSVFKEGL